MRLSTTILMYSSAGGLTSLVGNLSDSSIIGWSTD